MSIKLHFQSVISVKHAVQHQLKSYWAIFHVNYATKKSESVLFSRDLHSIILIGVFVYAWWRQGMTQWDEEKQWKIGTAKQKATAMLHSKLLNIKYLNYWSNQKLEKMASVLICYNSDIWILILWQRRTLNEKGTFLYKSSLVWWDTLLSRCFKNCLED